jgi:dTDP-4-dehydrorhamnose reductase
MKVLILGNKGMLGSDLYAKFFPDHEVVGKDIEDFNITSLADCRDVVQECAPDCVINTVAYTNVDGCETDEAACFAINAEGVKNLAEACRAGVKIVHFSTDYVFDGTKGNPYVEGDLTNPINAYGRSKLQGERYLRETVENLLLIRTAWLYGKNGQNFVKTILKKAGNEKMLRVVSDQIGSPTYTRDLAGAVKILVEGDYRGLFHLTNRGRCNWYEFSLKILEYAGVKGVDVEPISSDRSGRGALRPCFSVMSGQKFVSATGKAMRFWQIALQEFIDENWAMLISRND